MEGIITSQKIVLYLILLLSVCFHEWAHAFIADKLGDPTPKMDGRLTLNPASHIDMVGTVICPMIFILFGSTIPYGWGKSVYPNTSYFTSEKKDELLFYCAGPAMNLILCLIVSIITGIALRFIPMDPTKAVTLFISIVKVNCLLAIFNCLPIPPLDGSYIMKNLTKMSDEAFMMLSQWSIFIFLGLIFFSPLGQLIEILIQSLTYTPFYKVMIIISGAATS